MQSSPFVRSVARILLLALTLGCRDESTRPQTNEPRPPTLRVAITGPHSVAAGATVTFTATVLDESHAPATGIVVEWESSHPEIAAVDSNGNVSGRRSGSALIRAHVPGASAQRSVSVSELLPVARIGVFPREVVLAPGDSGRLTSRVTAEGNIPLDRRPAYESSAPEVVSVTAAGVLVAMGEGTAEIVASLEGKTGSARVRVQRRAARTFSIDLRIIGDSVALPIAEFRRAVERWERVVVGGTAPQRLISAAATCESWAPAIDETVQGLLVLLRVAPIDGPGKVVAGTRVCVIREGTRQPVLATVELDADDIEMERVRGSLASTFAHELGHALGFGALWYSHAAGPPLAEARPEENRYVYNGSAAKAAAYNWGALLTPSGPLLLERQGGAGSAGSHWSRTDAGEELMTAFATGGDLPLGTMTMASMRDLGYEVDETGAQWSFAPPANGAALSILAPDAPLEERIGAPRLTVGADGRPRRLR